MQLDALFPALQHRMHQQGFGTGSIREIMQTLSAEIPRVAEDDGVSAIVSKWELPYWSETVELVDLTPQIVALIDPSERALGVVESVKASAPISMEQLLAHEEGGQSIAEAIRPVIGPTSGAPLWNAPRTGERIQRYSGRTGDRTRSKPLSPILIHSFVIACAARQTGISWPRIMP